MIAIANGIQSGEVTHHQDQSILSVSLRTKNMRKRIILNDTEEDLVFCMFLLFIYKYKNLILNHKINI